jgi:pimeloyl-ACP methyl ester carboxylesterase
MFLKAATLLLALAATTPNPQGRTEWLGATGHRTKARIYTNPQLTGHPTLVMVLHGDAPFNKPSYQYTLASRAAAAIPDTIVAAILRPGYTDPDNDTSDGIRGHTTGDNYTPEVLDQLGTAIKSLTAEIQPGHVVLVGHSGGSTLSADLIARYPHLAQGALLVSCPCDVPAFRHHMFWTHPNPYWFYPLTSISPLDGVKDIDPKTKIRMIVGSNDPIALPEYTSAYADAARARHIDVQTVFLPGKEHEIFLEPAVIDELQKLIDSLR